MARRFQFSIRLLLVTTAFVAMAMWGLTEKSSGIAIAVVFGLSAVFASISILASALSTGTVKAFWIGIAVPTAMHAIGAALLLALVFRGSDARFFEDGFTTNSLRITASILWGFAPLNGAVCALLHRAFWRTSTATRDAPDFRFHHEP